MRKGIIAAAVAVTGVFAVPAIAAAQNAVLTTSVAVRAGPGVDYPAVVRAGRGSAVNVHGCLAGWSWCDIGIAGNRGWVPGNRVQYFRSGRYVLLPAYAPAFGVPVVTFAFGDYWNRWYVGRPWYYDRGYWGRWGVGFRVPVAPPGWRPWHPGWDHRGFYPGRGAAFRAGERAEFRHDREVRGGERFHGGREFHGGRGGGGREFHGGPAGGGREFHGGRGGGGGPRGGGDHDRGH